MAGRGQRSRSGLCLVTSGGRPGGASGLRLHTRLVAGVARVLGHVVATRGRLAEGQEATHAVIGGHPPPLPCCLAKLPSPRKEDPLRLGQHPPSLNPTKNPCYSLT